MYPTPGAYAQRPPSAGTAETLILVGFVFQIIFSLVLIFLIVPSFFTIFAIAVFAPGFAAVFAGIAVAIGLLAIFMLYVAYQYSYRRVRAGQYEEARGPTLLLGILGIIFGSIITGIFYLIGYMKIGDAQNEARGMTSGGWAMAPQPMMPGQWQAAPAPATPMQAPPPGGTPMPGATAPVMAAPAPAAAVTCPRCGGPATYISQYGRWYCYRDQAYL